LPYLQRQEAENMGKLVNILISATVLVLGSSSEMQERQDKMEDQRSVLKKISTQVPPLPNP
jgi:hypothetical protein